MFQFEAGSVQGNLNTLGVGIGGLSDTELSGEDLDKEFDRSWQDAADIESLFGEGGSQSLRSTPLQRKPL